MHNTKSSQETRETLSLGETLLYSDNEEDQSVFSRLEDESNKPECRKPFIKKVYSIFIAHVVASVLISGFMILTDDVHNWIKMTIKYSYAFKLALLIYIILSVLIILNESTRKKTPWNHVVIASLTLIGSYLSTIRLLKENNNNINAVLVAALVTIASIPLFSLLAKSIKYDFNHLHKLAVISLLISCAVQYFYAAAYDECVHNAISLGTLVIIFISRAQFIIGGRHISEQLAPDDYITGAYINLYFLTHCLNSVYLYFVTLGLSSVHLYD
jgi:hypothetical protein